MTINKLNNLLAHVEKRIKRMEQENIPRFIQKKDITNFLKQYRINITAEFLEELFDIYGNAFYNVITLNNKKLYKEVI